VGPVSVAMAFQKMECLDTGQKSTSVQKAKETSYRKQRRHRKPDR